jgi:acetylornithine/succinyldiaminopimelate/putrescine aminotransferase
MARARSRSNIRRSSARCAGSGLLVGVELTNEGYGGWIIPEMLKAGVTAAWTLNQQRVIRLEPPLIVTEGEVEIARWRRCAQASRTAAKARPL